MQTETINELLEELIRKIRDRFPGVLLEFSSQPFPAHAELWVYVLQLEHCEAVKQFAKELEGSLPESEYPIWVFVKSWSGPWPGGESEEELKRRRREFKDRMAQHQETG